MPLVPADVLTQSNPGKTRSTQTYIRIVFGY